MFIVQVLLIALIGGVVYYLYIEPTNERIDHHFKEFPLLTYEDSLSGTIISISKGPSELRGLPAAFTFDNGTKYTINASQEILSNRVFLTNVVPGALLFKKPENDTIIMTKFEYNDTISYKFIIHKNVPQH